MAVKLKPTPPFIEMRSANSVEFEFEIVFDLSPLLMLKDSLSQLVLMNKCFYESPILSFSDGFGSLSS